MITQDKTRKMILSKKRFAKFLSFLTFVFISTTIAYSQTQKPNIIFILTDDHRADALGYAGNKIAHTPEMDKLATEGTYFKNAFSSTPICAASRASIISGLYERTHQYNFRTGNIKDEYMQKAYPHLLKNAGYYTGFFGKFGVNYDHLDQLYNVHDSYDRNTKYKDKRGYYYKKLGKDTVHLTRYTGQQALDFIADAPKDKPFCLQLSFSAPHAHDGAPEQYFAQAETQYLYQNTNIPQPKLANDSYFNELPESVKSGFNRLRWTWRFNTPQKYQQMMKNYYRMIAGVDMEIAKIRGQLKAKGLDKNTIIILMGDNGYFLGERQLADKWLMYDLSVRIPLIIMDPRNPNHNDADEMALNLDIPSTILDFAGVKQPSTWHGESLKPIVADKKAVLKRDTILLEHLWEFNEIPPSEGVRTAEWKYFRYVNNKSLEYLYQLKNDPQETKNLAENPKYQAKLIEFRNKLEELILKYKDPYSGIPSGLTVNFERSVKDAVIKDDKPVFSWEVPAEAGRQLAYQILVSSTKEKSDFNQGDLWNSKQIRSNKLANVLYQGQALKPDIIYYWKVRIWDASNRNSSYSVPQAFKIIPDKSFNHPSIFQIDSIKPAQFKKVNNTLFIDFGKDAFGTLTINYQAKKAEIITIRLGEQLNPDGTLNSNLGVSSIRFQEVKLAVNPNQTTYQINLKADKRNTKPGAVLLPKSLPVLMPFRYVEIEGNKQEIEKNDVTQLFYHTYFDDTASSFSSSDTILNQIWDLCKYSIKATSFTGVYVDGDRERIPYEADAYINQLGHYATDKEYTIAQNTIEYFMQYPTWPTEWQLHVAMMLEQDYLYTGNTQLIAKYYKPLKYKTLMELANNEGLISTKSPKLTKDFMQKLGFKDTSIVLKDITDWPPAQKDTEWKLATAEGERDGFVFMPYNTIINALYYKNMQIMAEFAKVLNKPEEENMFRLKALKAKMAMNQQMLDKKTKIYTDGIGTNHSSLHANMFALAFNLVPQENIKPVADFLKSRGMACSVYGAQYLMEALYNANEADYALELMTSKSDRSWYNMIRVGATMTMEAWDMKYKPNSDWNHAWGAVPANAIPRLMWGIQPKTAGASIIQIKPQLSTLTESNIKVPFLGGEVKASYKRKGLNNQQYEFEIPANMSAELILNYSPNDTVILNGEKVNLAFGSIRLNPGLNKVELIVNTF